MSFKKIKKQGYSLENSIILIYTFYLFGYIFTRGFYSTTGVIILLFTLFFLILTLFKKKFIPQINKGVLLSFTLFLTVTLSSVLYGGIYQINHYAQESIRWLLILAIPLSIIYLLKLPKDSLLNRYKFIFLLLIALISKCLMVISSPTPYIDTYDTLKLGAYNFVHGQNP